MRHHLENLLAAAARRVIAKAKPDVIAVTGSVGKSSAKQAIAAVLAGKFDVRATPGNLNTEIGLPLTVLGLPAGRSSKVAWLGIAARACWRSRFVPSDYPKTLVLEMAADKPGDLAKLCAVAPPTVAVVTAVGESHLEKFGSLEAIAAEKRVPVERLGERGLAVLNRDDERVYAMREKTKAKVVTFGFHEEADMRALPDIHAVLDPARPGMHFKIAAGGSTVPIFLPGVIGRHSLYAALAAAAVAMERGMNLVEIADGLMKYRPAPGRMRLLSGIKRSCLIDDTYNASPKSALAAIEALDEAVLAAPDDRKFAVLGDMLELGAMSEAGHREVVALAAKAADVLVLVGEQMTKAAKDLALGEEKVRLAATASEAGLIVQRDMRQGDLILVKGSRGMQMERVVKEVMADPMHAKELLVKVYAE